MTTIEDYLNDLIKNGYIISWEKIDEKKYVLNFK